MCSFQAERALRGYQLRSNRCNPRSLPGRIDPASARRAVVTVKRICYIGSAVCVTAAGSGSGNARNANRMKQHGAWPQIYREDTVFQNASIDGWLARIDEGRTSAGEIARECYLAPESVIHAVCCRYLDSGEVERAQEMLRNRIGEVPDPDLHNLYLKCLMASPSTTKAMFREESLRWSRLHADTSRAARDHDFSHLGLDPDKRLSVGILCGYAWSTLFEVVFTPLFAAIDRGQFRLVLFNMGALASEPLRATFDVCIDMLDPSPANLLAATRDHGLDILIDLNGRFRLDNPVELFVRRAAPVQISYGNMLATYGLDTINYIMADRYIIPPEDDHLYTERVYRFATDVSGTFLLPQHPVTALPCATAQPISAQNPFTFGSFNATFKLNDLVLDTWGRIVKAVPGSRLLLKAGGINAPRVRQRIAAMASRHDITDCVFVQDMTPMADMLKQYNLVDLALNPFPYSGGTTSAYALWFGSPSLTLEDDELLQCGGGAAMLKEVGLDEFIVGSVDAYVERAVHFATMRSELARVRATMRERLARSARFNPEMFARDFAAGLRWIWKDWLANADLASPTDATSQ